MGGNTIPQQRRGKGKKVYITPDFYFAGKFSLRPLDDKEKIDKIKGRVVDLIKDKGHYSPIAKIKFEDGTSILVPAVENIYIGKEIYAGVNAPVENGNILPLKFIPDGSLISMVELVPGDGGRVARTSGTSCLLVQKTDKYAIIRLPSGKNKNVNLLSRAIIGTVAGSNRTDKPFVRAGNKYYFKKAHHKIWPINKPTARNVADHPLGGKHKRNKGGMTPLPKYGYPIKYGKYGSKRTGRRKGNL
ncbi:50S ribosomal protein L2 [Nanobdella aerobiophila]|uniref:50S ribosomal protein L2 n=1 Tax=Nanobdella aerobiophila TaxID=2586965 RepID=A0A915T043_9ARCH|nr:50S ribosomal protein L2 [Nanobdella aerobiophila]BBL45679.1 50S ribosomal protein L2 [Nanobdella aerobiophila]